jgi:hypothetical protein
MNMDLHPQQIGHALALCDRIRETCAHVQQNLEDAATAIKEIVATVRCSRCGVTVALSALGDPNRCHKNCPLNEKVQREAATPDGASQAAGGGVR